MFLFRSQRLSFIVAETCRSRPLVTTAQLVVLALAIAVHASASPQATANETCFRPPKDRRGESSRVAQPKRGIGSNTEIQVSPNCNGRRAGALLLHDRRRRDDSALRVHPGDRLIIHFVNEAPVGKYSSSPPSSISEKRDCADPDMGFFSTNLHFHGMSIPPVCHQDDVLHTFVQPGQKFDYDVRIPANQPPGLYWYHPHVHGITESQVQGGASGALIVEGIEKQRPFLAGMPQRVFVIRDQQLTPSLDHTAPSWDLSINYVPILYPTLLPATVQTNPHEKEFWRVVNAGADTILDLQLLRDGQAQKVQLVALDGVAVQAANSSVEHIPLPPGARAEFVVETPPGGEQQELITRRWDTGPAGDNDPRRPLAQVISKAGAPEAPRATASISPQPRNSGEIPWKGPTLERKLYFSESSPNPSDPDISTFFFITVVGQEPEKYAMGLPPNIVLHQGAVEAWTIENRSAEDHDFHIHQLHFQVLAIDGKLVHDGEIRDTINVPHWQGAGPYPSVKLLMDFRDPKIVGTFPYHCHIEKHADMGMMGTVEVLPPGVKTSVVLNFSPPRPEMGDEVKFTATVVPQKSSGPPLTGEVQLNIDGVNKGEMATLSNGRAVIKAFFPANGEHVVKAMYWGDPDHGESASVPAIVKVR